MAHSPRLINDELDVCLSATGELAKVDVNTGDYKWVADLNGFARGMARA
jgi:hypothetical protein